MNWVKVSSNFSNPRILFQIKTEGLCHLELSRGNANQTNLHTDRGEAW